MTQRWDLDDTDRVVDAIGLTCPMPALMARKALGAMAPGARALIRATDPLARIDIPHFCAEAGHELLAMREANGVLEFLVRKGGNAQ